MSERAIELMKLAAQYITEYCDDMPIFYDDAECDGMCLAQDILAELESLTNDR